MNNQPPNYNPYYYRHPAASYYSQPANSYYPQVPHAPGNPAGPAPKNPPGRFLENNSTLIKGVLVGAAVAYVLSNDKFQQGAIKTAVKSWSLLQGGIEEMKERFRDAEAELHSAHMVDDE